MAPQTKDEYIAALKVRLAEIDAAITKARKQQEYNADDGQGKIAVKRGALQFMIDEAQDLRMEILGLEHGDSSAIQVRPL